MNNEKIVRFLKQAGIKFLQDQTQKYFTQAAIPSGENEASVQNYDYEVTPGSEYEDGDAFVADLQKSLQAVIKKPSPEMLLPLVFELTKQMGRVVKFNEVQETKRTEIIAKRDILIAHIEKEKAVLLKYLEKSFDERKESFAKLFTMADQALADQNNERLALILNSINFIAAESPFKALHSINDTQKALEDKKHTWDF